jgi:hypothetical protein
MKDSGEGADHTELRVKHLEILQEVIARMSSNGATIKRSSLVVAAAAISVATALGKPLILLFTAAYLWFSRFWTPGISESSVVTAIFMMRFVGSRPTSSQTSG